MAAWVLVPCGEQLRRDVSRIAPNRDKTSDGTIGDAAHQQRVSDHNDDEVGRVPIRDADSKHEVHAWDADDDLREPGLAMITIVLFLVDRCRRGLERRLRYIIYAGWIWEASNGWNRRAYNGDNPHNEHAHFSFSYETNLEADTSSWHLEEIPVALTEGDKDWLEATITRIVDARVDQLTVATPLNGPDGKPDGTSSTPVGHNTWNQGVPNPWAGKRTYAWDLLGDIAEAVKGLQAPPSE
jgi:hypothetical protein